MIYLALLAVSVLVSFLIAHLLGLDSMDDVFRVFNNLFQSNQHIASRLFQVSRHYFFNYFIAFQVDETSKRHGGELVAQVLKVVAFFKTIFGVGFFL